MQRVLIAMIAFVLAMVNGLTALGTGVASAAESSGAAACVVLQPDEATSFDAWINQDNVTDNKNDSELRVKTESGKLNRALIKFDLAGSVPANAKVTSATLSLWVKGVTGNATINAHQLSDFWTENQVTWRYQDKVTTEEWTNPGADYAGTVLDSEAFVDGGKDYWATFNVSTAAQSWAQDSAANYGVILEAAVTNPKSETKFKSSADGTASQRPKLDLCFDIGVGISPNNLLQGAAGVSSFYSHTVTVTDFVNEPVNLSAISNQGWTVNIYKDVNGNGVKDAGDDPISQTAPLGPNGSTKILVEVVVPANAPDGIKDVTTVTVTGANNGTVAAATDTTQVGFPPVADPVLDGKRDDAYSLNLDATSQDYCAAPGEDGAGTVLARLMTLYDVTDPNYVWVVLEMARAHVDNTYGTNIHPSWTTAGKSHSLGSMDGSDKGQVLLRDANGTLIFDVTSDYVDTGLGTVSGWGSAGVTGGEGSIALGDPNKVAVESSMGYNLNHFCTNSSSCTVAGVDLFSDSPPVNADYAPLNPTFADWQFSYLYEFRFDISAFGAAGFGSAMISNVHVSPNKTGSNEILVEPCDGSIGDRVWRDTDGDKVQDPSESGLNGVQVILYEDTGDNVLDPNTDLAIDTLFTSGDGDYDFTGLGPGTYFVDVVNGSIPVDYVSTTLNDPLKVELAIGQDYNDADFGYNQPESGYTITKVLNTPDPVRPLDPISFTITIRNTGQTWITTLPLVDVYDPVYITYVNANPNSVNNTDDGTINWTDLTAQLHDLAPSGQPNSSLQVVVNFLARADTTLLTPDSKTNNRATATGVKVDRDGPNTGASEDPNPLPDQSDNARVQIINPTAVTLAAATAEKVADGVLVRWQTVNETDMTGFNLLRSTDGVSFEQVNGELILAQQAGLSEGAAYEFVDGSAVQGSRYTYRLEILAVGGTATQVPLVTLSTGFQIYLPVVNR